MITYRELLAMSHGPRNPNMDAARRAFEAVAVLFSGWLYYDHIDEVITWRAGNPPRWR